MKLAIVGSRALNNVLIDTFITDEIDEIITGGAAGIDTIAAEFAKRNQIKLTVFLPEYDRYGRAAPIVRNKLIVDAADRVLAFWDGHSRGALSVLEYSKRIGKAFEIVIINHSN